MALFSGTHHMQFDVKGRVSIPAPFRVALRESSSVASLPTPVSIPLILRPHMTEPCIEAWTEHRFEALQASLDKFDPLSPERDALALVVFGDAHTMETDREGRIVIDPFLLTHAGLTRARANGVAYVGLGTGFQIWEPEALAARKAEARAVYHGSPPRLREPAAP